MALRGPLHATPALPLLLSREGLTEGVGLGSLGALGCRSRFALDACEEVLSFVLGVAALHDERSHLSA